MRKVIYKYFFDFLEGQEKWLNKMAKEGYKLIKVNKISYEFEKCRPSQYEYRVEFVADKSNSQIKDYKNFLEDEMEYNSFNKNININWSLGKVRFRPWAKQCGKVAINPGSYNGELLILEKEQDGKIFDIHTCKEDLIKYITSIRNMYLFTTLLLMFIICTKTIESKMFLFMVVSITIILVVQFIKYCKLIEKYKKYKKTYE